VGVRFGNLHVTIGDKELAQLQALPTLQLAYLVGINLTDHGLESVRGLCRLQVLSLYSASWQGGRDSITESLPLCPDGP
jgi:hypothetical protein